MCVFSVRGHLRPSSPRPCMSPPSLQLYLNQDGPNWGEFLIVTLLQEGASASARFQRASETVKPFIQAQPLAREEQVQSPGPRALPGPL